MYIYKVELITYDHEVYKNVWKVYGKPNGNDIGENNLRSHALNSLSVVD